MATATHTFVRLDYQESDGTITHEEFEMKDDVQPIGLTAYRKEVTTDAS